MGNKYVGHLGTANDMEIGRLAVRIDDEPEDHGGVAACAPGFIGRNRVFCVGESWRNQSPGNGG